MSPGHTFPWGVEIIAAGLTEGMVWISKRRKRHSGLLMQATLEDDSMVIQLQHLALLHFGGGHQ